MLLKTPTVTPMIAVIGGIQIQRPLKTEQCCRQILRMLQLMTEFMMNTCNIGEFFCELPELCYTRRWILRLANQLRTSHARIEVLWMIF